MFKENFKNRRKCRPYAPYIFLLLQITAISILVYIISYITYFDQKIIIVSGIVALLYITKFFNRTLYVLNRCKAYEKMKKIDKETFIKNF